MSPTLRALAFVLAPVAAGGLVAAVLGVALRTARHLRSSAFAALAVAPALLVWRDGASFPSFSLYDLFVWAVSFGVSLLVAASLRGKGRSAWGGLALTLVVSAGGVGVLEWWCRHHPLPIAEADDPALARWRFRPEERAWQCPSLYPAPVPVGHFGQRETPDFPPRDPSRRRVLHIGDSMTVGGDVPFDDRFVNLLDEAREPREEHLNLGISNTDTDAELVVARTWIKRLQADAVYLHIFPCNDIGGMDSPYYCCDDGPLLSYDTTPPANRCETPRWRFTREALLTQGPPPYALRVAAAHSELAHQLTYWWYQNEWRLGAWAERRGGERAMRVPEEQPAHFRAALLAIRDEARKDEVPLTAVVMPCREAVAGGPAEHERESYAIAMSALEEGGIDHLDAWPVFVTALEKDPKAPLFQHDHNNPHFDVAGHHLYASWLLRAMEKREQ